MSATLQTTLLISNLHCNSCVKTIRETLSALSPPPTSIHASVVSQSVTIQHSPSLSESDLRSALDEAGFDIVLPASSATPGSPSAAEHNIYQLRRSSNLIPEWLSRKRAKHAAQCLLCRNEQTALRPESTTETLAGLPHSTSSKALSIAETLVNHNSPSDPRTSALGSHGFNKNALEDIVDEVDSVQGPFIAIFSIDGMTCSSCVGNVTRAAAELPGVTNISVNLINNSAAATVERRDVVDTVKSAIEDGGYGCELMSVERIVPVKPKASVANKATKKARTMDEGPYHVVFSVDGMTCASCVSNVTRALEAIKGVTEIGVDLVGKSAAATVDRRELADIVKEAIEDCGYGVEVISNEAIEYDDDDNKLGGPRTVNLKVEGMFCQHCPGKLVAALKDFEQLVTVHEPLPSHTSSPAILKLTYTPSPSSFTLRTILRALSAASSPPFQISIAHPPSLESRARAIHIREQRSVLLRLLFSVVVAIPTFLIGIVFMTLLPADAALRMWVMEPIWVGNASRAQWALLLLATPVMFYSASHFHKRCLKEIWGLWKRGSRTPVWRRFIRFGSMNSLVSMGVTVAYLSSIALLALAAAQPPAMDGMGDSTTYFDTVVLLTMFLLAGRFLEAYSKTRTADAITELGKLRPTEALVLEPRGLSALGYATMDADLEKGAMALEQVIQDDESMFNEKDVRQIASISPTPTASHSTSTPLSPNGLVVQKIPVDQLEMGDIVRVPHGASPPADGTVVTPDGALFDESSLTGESRPVRKECGDKVFVGTVNRGGLVEVRVTTLGGETMLDQIVKVVREGATKRAPIERVADFITGYFVPVITLFAIITWVIWLSLGLTGTLPADYLDNPIGGWIVWALEFAIAVFVVACPCGIGLAAPTALLVGAGLAAKHGILVRGGGEAFQEAAQLDIVVFDKTGTLTAGGEPQVTNANILEHQIPEAWGPNEKSRALVYSVVAELEEASSHPLGLAMRQYCERVDGVLLGAAVPLTIEETAGRGLKGVFTTPQCTAIIGNEKWIEEHGASISVEHERSLQEWKSEGKSIIVFAVRVGDESTQNTYQVIAIFAAADELRPEAKNVVAAIQKQGLGTWMISGDNLTTAKAVARNVGIPETNVIAGVLPQEKAEKIAWLQQVGMKRPSPMWKRVLRMKELNERCIVAMVGDGINDAPALTTADVGIAVGSGSDVALSSASFILIKSDLRSILTLTDLSRKVFNRVKFNFAWALCYNMAALPIAAGVLYPAGHIRLDPVWASLAMALSSVSVVMSSLHLRLYRAPKV